MRIVPNRYLDFSVHVAPNPDGGTHVAVYGELDLATIDEADAAFDQAIEAEGPVVIDLRACGFVDSKGIASLLKVALRLREQNRDLTIQGVQQRVMETFERAGVTSMAHLALEPQERREGPRGP